MKIRNIILLIGLVSLFAFGVSASKKSTKGTQPVHTIHTDNDTIWARYGSFLQPLILSSLVSPDSSELPSEYALLLYAGKDSLRIEPTPEPVRIWMISNRDSVLELVSFQKPAPDTVKLNLLRQHGKFGTVPAPATIKFTYRSAIDSALVNLRTTYNLDSVAGHGDEFSRMTNLLHWVHKTIRHDGNSLLPLPKPPTTMNILKAAIDDHQPFYCGILGHVLIDAYLAEGFKARFLGCLPADPLDQDSHGVTIVWSNERKKWILMDPTFDVWFTDPAGLPLSPMEIRSRMASGDSIRIADCINWNGQTHDKMGHFNYMAKNLFRMRSAARWISSPLAESKFVDLWLIPDGYTDKLLGVVDSTTTHDQITYQTDDADLFFAPPGP
jgi:hypothetical protein